MRNINYTVTLDIFLSLNSSISYSTFLSIITNTSTAEMNSIWNKKEAKYLLLNEQMEILIYKFVNA